MHRNRFGLAFLLCAIAVVASRAPADEIKLALVGGPLARRVTFKLNGEFLAEVTGRAPQLSDLDELLRTGENALEIEVDPEVTGAAGRDLQVSVQPVRKTDERTYEPAGRPLAHVLVPAGAGGNGACKETLPFWAGPPSPPAAGTEPLKNRYWLIVQGPAGRHMVTVKLNDRTVLRATQGTAFYEVTEHVIKGKNTVSYEAKPTCFAQTPPVRSELAIYIATGVEKPDLVEMTSEPMVEFRLPHGSEKAPPPTELAFRGR